LILGNAKLDVVDLVSAVDLAEVQDDAVDVVVSRSERSLAQCPFRADAELIVGTLRAVGRAVLILELQFTCCSVALGPELDDVFLRSVEIAVERVGALSFPVVAVLLGLEHQSIAAVLAHVCFHGSALLVAAPGAPAAGGAAFKVGSITSKHVGHGIFFLLAKLDVVDPVFRSDFAKVDAELVEVIGFGGDRQLVSLPFGADRSRDVPLTLIGFVILHDKLQTARVDVATGFEAQSIGLAGLQRHGEILHHLCRPRVGICGIDQMGASRSVLTGFHPFACGAVTPSRPRTEIRVKAAVGQHAGDVAICLDDHCRSDETLEIGLRLLLIPDEVMTIKPHLGRHGIEESVYAGKVELATVAHHGIHLHGIAGSEHLEVLIGQPLEDILVVLGIQTGSHAQPHKHVGCILLGILLDRRIVGQYLFHGERYFLCRHGAVAFGRAPFHDLVVASRRQQQGGKRDDDIVEFHNAILFSVRSHSRRWPCRERYGNCLHRSSVRSPWPRRSSSRRTSDQD